MIGFNMGSPRDVESGLDGGRRENRFNKINLDRFSNFKVGPTAKGETRAFSSLNYLIYIPLLFIPLLIYSTSFHVSSHI